MKKVLFTIIISLFFSIFSISQQTKTNLSYKTSAEVDSLLTKLKKEKADTTKIKLYLKIGDEFEYSIPDTALYYYNKALELSCRAKDKEFEAQCIDYIGYVYRNQDNYVKAIKCFKKSLKIKEEIGDKNGVSASYVNIGNIHINQCNYNKAIEYYQKSLKIVEQNGNLQRISICLNNIGIIYLYMENYELAIDYYKKALDISKKLNDMEGISYALNNIGGIYIKQSDFIKALDYYQKALKINKETDNKKGMSRCLNNIGIINKNLGKYEQAVINYKDAFKINEGIKDKIGMSSCLINLGNLYLKMGNYNKAIQSVEKSLVLAKEVGAKNEIKDTYSSLAVIYAEIKDFEKAYHYNQLYSDIKDTIFNKESSKQLHEMEAKYQTEKKQQEIEKQQIILEKKDAEIKMQEAKTSRQKIQRNAFIGGFALMLVLAFIVFISYRQKKKANILLAEQKYEIEEKNEELNQQNEEILTQRDEIESHRDIVIKQKEHIEEIHKNLTDSINYAERIQQAVLPGNKFLLENFHDHFVLFMPHSVVSGDFYWVTRVNKWLIFTAADCTGHGVPGAFMSMLGISFLNEIVRKSEITQANEVLNELRRDVIGALQQKGIDEGQRDGLDIAFCVLNTETNMLQFAGANNPLYIIRNGNNNGNVKTLHPKMSGQVATTLQHELTEIKADLSAETRTLFEVKSDKMPISIYAKMGSFTNNEIQLQKGDSLYIFSDGYADQFGGAKGRKFRYKPFKEMLLANAGKPMLEQRDILAQTFEEWKGDLKQIDDVVVLGIKI